MQLRKITDSLEISGEVYSTSQAWGHEVRAFYNGQEIAKHRVRYYNRTWERYQFESAFLGLMGKLDQASQEAGAWSLPLSERVKLAQAIRNY